MSEKYIPMRLEAHIFPESYSMLYKAGSGGTYSCGDNNNFLLRIDFPRGINRLQGAPHIVIKERITDNL